MFSGRSDFGEELIGDDHPLLSFVDVFRDYSDYYHTLQSRLLPIFHVPLFTHFVGVCPLLQNVINLYGRLEESPLSTKSWKVMFVVTLLLRCSQPGLLSRSPFAPYRYEEGPSPDTTVSYNSHIRDLKDCQTFHDLECALLLFDAFFPAAFLVSRSCCGNHIKTNHNNKQQKKQPRCPLLFPVSE